MKKHHLHSKWLPLDRAEGKQIKNIGSITEGEPIREMEIGVNFTDGTRLIVSARAELHFEFLEVDLKAMLELPETIFLLDMGDEVVWCEHPDPDTSDRSPVQYVKADLVEAAGAENAALRGERDALIGVLDRIETAVMAPGDAPPPQTRDELAEYVENELEAKASFWASFQSVSRVNQRLRKALWFYADDYEPDSGYTARAALELPDGPLPVEKKGNLWES